MRDTAYLQRIQAEHAAIRDAIGARAADRAREAARLHLVGSLERYRLMMGRVERHA